MQTEIEKLIANVTQFLGIEYLEKELSWVVEKEDERIKGSLKR